MPATQIRLFRDEDGSTPLIKWLSEVEARNRKTYEKCRSYLQRLATFGRELRRPTADYLRDGVYELRIKHLGVNYRILYGFVGSDIVLVSHGITKEKKVPAREIELAAARITKYRSNPRKYCAAYSSENPSSENMPIERDSKVKDSEQHEGMPLDPDLQQQILQITDFQNVSNLVYEIISHAQDELITSPQYERMRNLLDGFEDGLLRSGVMRGERLQDPNTEEVSFDGDELFKSWLIWKIAVLCSITPPSEGES